jgi:hypothetical protein
MVCQDNIRSDAETLVRAPCGHKCHTACVTHLFDCATRNESLFPPSCCGHPIPLRTVRRHLPSALLALFLEKRHEWSTVNRVYCANRTCGRFLGRKDERRRPRAFRCSGRGCRTRTCARCKRRVDFGGVEHDCECDGDPDAGVMKLSRDAGWRRCPGCESMVERNAGCNHMTCRCRTEFCYVCGARWKTCACLRSMGVRE